MPGNGAVRPSVRTSGYGSSSQNNTPTSPADRNVPFDSPSSRIGGRNDSVNSGVDGAPTTDGRSGRGLDTNIPGSRDLSSPRDRSRPNGRSNKPPGSTHRSCKKCGEPLTGQFVRALGGTYHLECFKCEVCALAPQVRRPALIMLRIGLRPDRSVQILPYRLRR